MKSPGRLFGCLLALALTLSSLPAAAAQTNERDFDHKTIGFKLYGGHATAACERCHVDGIYKGTPRNCNGCHALGKYLLKPAALASAELAPAPLTTPPESGSDAAAKQAVEKQESQARGTSHMATGFPLSGGHATAACATCHVDGVFKGTPKKCDDCHSVGKRIVATPKSTSHLPTDAPCDSCHFNTSTWLGARFNHGAARPGQCATCHNGRIAAGKHSGHVATSLSCDQCHRSSSWFPASWNHTGAQYAAQDCGTCHNASGPGRNYTTTARHTTFINLAISNCKSCHTNYYSFHSYYYIHDKPFASCAECHANSAYKDGVSQAASAIHPLATAIGITDCRSCHKNYTSFPNAQYDHAGAAACQNCHNGSYTTSDGKIKGKSPAHIPYAAGAECGACHGTTSWTSIQNSPVMHTTYLTGFTCTTCHGPTSTYAGGRKGTAGDHDDPPESTLWQTQDCSSSGCHRPLGGEGTAYIDWD